jgi:hypothetical protein
MEKPGYTRGLADGHRQVSPRRILRNRLPDINQRTPAGQALFKKTDIHPVPCQIFYPMK